MSIHRGQLGGRRPPGRRAGRRLGARSAGAWRGSKGGLGRRSVGRRGLGGGRARGVFAGRKGGRAAFGIVGLGVALRRPFGGSGVVGRSGLRPERGKVRVGIGMGGGSGSLSVLGAPFSGPDLFTFFGESSCLVVLRLR